MLLLFRQWLQLLFLRLRLRLRLGITQYRILQLITIQLTRTHVRNVGEQTFKEALGSLQPLLPLQAPHLTLLQRIKLHQQWYSVTSVIVCHTVHITIESLARHCTQNVEVRIVVRASRIDATLIQHEVHRYDQPLAIIRHCTRHNLVATTRR